MSHLSFMGSHKPEEHKLHHEQEREKSSQPMAYRSAILNILILDIFTVHVSEKENRAPSKRWENKHILISNKEISHTMYSISDKCRIKSKHLFGMNCWLNLNICTLTLIRVCHKMKPLDWEILIIWKKSHLYFVLFLLYWNRENMKYCICIEILITF